MEKATIANLKNRLSAYLRKVRAGESVLIFDRNVPIARIERVASAGVDQRLARLEAAGLVRRGTKPLPLKKLASELPEASSSVLEALLDERAKSR